MPIDPIVGGCIIGGWIIVMLLVLRAEMAIKRLKKQIGGLQEALILREHQRPVRSDPVEVQR